RQQRAHENSRSFQDGVHGGQKRDAPQFIRRFARALERRMPCRDAYSPEDTMRTPLAPVVTVIMLGVGCGQTVSPTGSTTLLPSESSATLTGAAIATAAHREGHTEPFRGTLEGAVTVTPLEPPFANVFIAATGHATHLGRFTVDVPHLVNFA